VAVLAVTVMLKSQITTAVFDLLDAFILVALTGEPILHTLLLVDSDKTPSISPGYYHYWGGRSKTYARNETPCHQLLVSWLPQLDTGRSVELLIN
jgi:hypothetical protein